MHSSFEIRATSESISSRENVFRGQVLDRNNEEHIASLIRFYQRNWESVHRWLYAPEEMPDQSVMEEILSSDDECDRPAAAIFDDNGEIRAFAFAHLLDEEEKQLWRNEGLKEFMDAVQVYSISYMRDLADESSKGLIKQNLPEMTDTITDRLYSSDSCAVLLSIVDIDNRASLNVMKNMQRQGRAAELCEAYRKDELKSVYIIT